MGVNDAREQLEVAKAEVVRLERENDTLRRTLEDVTAWYEDAKAERAQLARLHEVATERTVQLAAVIEAADARVSEGTVNAVRMHELLRSADTSVLREVRAQAWEEGFATGLHEDDDYPNPYRQAEGESR